MYIVLCPPMLYYGHCHHPIGTCGSALFLSGFGVWEFTWTLLKGIQVGRVWGFTWEFKTALKWA